ncbi:MFS transporter [Mycobacterium intermedium]|uniref:MFS transporter n=1 Tax=Mycobacterium intermedium TaxID=28445 RepID=A0A1E3S3H9_MYCIE|nr:MFS transporter [Mycobacterium intermedium]MCV6964233.1 MFS transporter [Mycobacterium intermedium]ODQ96726.1 MFS transporter [Mycobacterium intermedium]OPE46527.1 MFS transporter [Mycobacterium intermedium]ORA94793.1 MFS transporter [Mycobacterium intermedium]
MPTEPISAVTRWAMVGIALVVTASAFSFINAVPFLIPSLETAHRTPLSQSGLLAAMPSLGMVVTLIAWGYLADRVGERIVLTAGSAITAVATYAAASVHSLPAMGAFLFVGGMGAASANPACGRLVAGWFAPHQRGLAMGIRQTAQPLGIAMGAFMIPRLAEHGPEVGLLFPAFACAASAVVAAIFAHDPPRKPRYEATPHELTTPYRGSTVLLRIHAIAALMVLPQALTVTFMFVWLTENHGWSSRAAGALVIITQMLSAASRIAAGRWSDRIGSRMRPIRVIALGTSVTMLMLAATNNLASPLAVAFMVAVSIITVMDNGLEATAITEVAGQFWSGRALGVQNTTQRIMALTAPPAFGALIESAGYPVAFAVCGMFPLMAVPLVPIFLLAPGLEDRADALSARRAWRKAVRSEQ